MILIGVLFFIFGIITFFDSALLAFGNILFLAGLFMIIGLQKTFNFFFKRPPQKLKGSLCFILGVALILIKYAFVGFIIEFFGILILFGDFFGVIIGFLRSLPIIGPILSSPRIAPVSVFFFFWRKWFKNFCVLT